MPNKTDSKPLELNCPTCNKTITWSDEYPDRPFCSARCKQIDFGDWANETHAIPGEPVPDPELLEEAQHTKH